MVSPMEKSFHLRVGTCALVGTCGLALVILLVGRRVQYNAAGSEGRVVGLRAFGLVPGLLGPAPPVPAKGRSMQRFLEMSTAQLPRVYQVLALNRHARIFDPKMQSQDTTIQSPFDVVDEAQASQIAADISSGAPLPLTEESVEAVLDGMRPYLIADGGNVALLDIDGGTVYLELQGACGSCPSSSMTMRMGLERGLREKIPEIIAVEQIAPDGAQVSEEGINKVLDEVRPFLKMANGDVQLLEVDAAGLQPSCTLRLTGSGAALRSIKSEIILRLRKNMPDLAGVLWVDEDGNDLLKK